MADDTTQAILAAHAAILDNLAAAQTALATGQAAIAIGLNAMAGVIERQQAEGTKTADAVAALNSVITVVQKKNEARWEESKARFAAAQAAMAEVRGGGSGS